MAVAAVAVKWQNNKISTILKIWDNDNKDDGYGGCIISISDDKTDEVTITELLKVHHFTQINSLDDYILTNYYLRPLT